MANITDSSAPLQSAILFSSFGPVQLVPNNISQSLSSQKLSQHDIFIEKSINCNQCDYTSFHVDHLRAHLTVEKSETNATNVIMPHLGQAI